MDPVQFIMQKRDGGTHDRKEFETFWRAYTRDDIPDYQVAAWLMAAYLKGLTTDETAWLTDAIRKSGVTLNCRDCDGPVVDKHSTGGVGDKTSIVLLPLLASCGVYVPMISGRGLGHTGGTLDKLESIPGMQVRLPQSEYDVILREHGGVFMAQTEDIAPLDKRLYSLRDVTGTVESIGLITASIIGKKAAEDLDALVLDVKFGSGAFMKTFDAAEELALSLSATGASLGMACSALLTDMEEPLGAMVGNTVEIAESIDMLEGKEVEQHFYDVTMALATEMYSLAFPEISAEEAVKRLKTALKDGSAREKFTDVICAQGVDKEVAEKLPASMPTASETVTVAAPKSGVVQAIHSSRLGRLLAGEGAGRMKITDEIDHAIGMKIVAPRGTHIEEGSPLAHVFVRDDIDSAAFATCFEISDAEYTATDVVRKRLHSSPEETKETE